MKLLIDVCLSPQWSRFLCDAGHDALHWSEVGPIDAPDRAIMKWARSHEYVVFTHDLDFSALLASSQKETPSVLQLRADDTLPDAVGPVILRALQQFEQELNEGALLSVDPDQARVRLLPIGD